ncbi:MAG: metal-dependent hydrolase [Microbacteriaceae bacterium]
MMGGSHAITGAAAWVAVTATAPGALGIMPLDPLGVGVGAVVCAGAALLPDADHPSATIAQSIPVIGKVGANAISGMVGGHRHGTHSLLAVPVIVFLAWLLQFAVVDVGWWHQPVPVGAGLAAVALSAFAAKAVRLVRRWPQAWAASVAVGAVVALFGSAEWVPAAVVLGFVVHLLGDFITVGGLPLLWPWNPKPPKSLAHAPWRMMWMPNGYFAVPVLGKTGSGAEWMLTTLVSGYLVVLTALIGVESIQG